jgi:glutamine synthetase
MDENNKYIFEYIWLDSDGEFRSKTKIMDIDLDKIDNSYRTFDIMNDVFIMLPEWNYDGSSTGQAETSNSEVRLIPAALYKDPFRKDIKNTYLVWCDVADANNNPLPICNRRKALEIFDKYQEEKPWFGIEQEYYIISPKTGHPLGFSFSTTGDRIIPPNPQSKYYCGVGTGRSLGRELAEWHMRYCLYAGIKICGINAEVGPGQWEYQIGPLEGIKAADDLWVSRYILNSMAETHDLIVSFLPKPLVGRFWNGSGCHTNFSTKAMRENGGIEHIMNAISCLEKTHDNDILYYGEDNHHRLTGLNETSSINKFTWGVGSRTTSVRIPVSVKNDGKGYFEDRRPAANCDPYFVTSLILKSIMS